MEQVAMLKSINDYFDRTSPEQFMQDLHETGCADMVEEIDDNYVGPSESTKRLMLEDK